MLSVLTLMVAMTVVVYLGSVEMDSYVVSNIGSMIGIVNASSRNDP